MTMNNIVVFDSEVCNNFERSEISDIEKKCQVNQRRSFASQCIATLAANMIKFSYGTLLGFTTILLAEFYKEDAEISMTLDELTWFGSYCFVLPVSAILTGILPKPLGCRATLLLAAIMYTIAGIIFYFATSVKLILVAQSISGLFSATSFVPGASYITEITEPQYRGVLLATGNLFVLIGEFFSILLGSLVHWRTIALVNLTFPLVGFVAIYFLPNSPCWLADKGRFDEARKSLAWLRGWVSPEQVKDEFSALLGHVQSKSADSVSDTDNVKDSRTITNNLKNHLKIYLYREFYIPLAIVSYLFTIKTLCGSKTISSHAIIMFDMINSPIDGHVATLIMFGLRILGAVICILIIHMTGIRKLLFSSLAISGSSTLMASLFLFLIKQKIGSESFTWIPTIMILFAALSSSYGTDKVTFILNVELFPLKVRTIGAGIVYFLYSILVSIGNKIYLYCVEIMTLEGIFLFHGLIHVVGIVTFYFIIPETKGKCLKEIEELYSKNKNK